MSKTLFKSVGKNFHSTMMDAMTSVVMNNDVNTISELFEFIGEVIDGDHYDANGKDKCLNSIYYAFNNDINVTATNYSDNNPEIDFHIDINKMSMPKLISLIGRMKIEEVDKQIQFFESILNAIDKDNNNNLSSLKINLMIGMLHTVDNYDYWCDLCDRYKKEISENYNSETSNHYRHELKSMSSNNLLGHALNFGNKGASNAIFDKIEAFQSPYNSDDQWSSLGILKTEFNKTAVRASSYASKNGGVSLNYIQEYMDGIDGGSMSISSIYKSNFKKFDQKEKFRFFCKICSINKDINSFQVDRTKYKSATERMWSDVSEILQNDIKIWDVDQIKKALEISIDCCSPQAFSLVYSQALDIEMAIDKKYLSKAFFPVINIESGCTEELVPIFFKEMLGAMKDLGIEISELPFEKGGNAMHHAARYLKGRQNEALPLLSSMLELELDPLQKDDRGWVVSSHLDASIRSEWQTIMKSREASRVAKNAIEDIFKEIKLKP